VTKMRMNSNKSNRITTLSYSFVELMVAVAVIGIFALMILPALMDAKANARAAFCANNLKQWGVGYQMYVADWNGWLPSEGGLAGSCAKKSHWFNAVPPYLKMTPYTQAREHFPFERLRIWVCPEKNLRNAKSTSELNSVFYGMNTYLDGDRNDDCPHHSLQVKLSSIGKPDVTVLLCDVYANNCFCDPMDTQFQTYPWQKNGQGLHQNGANFLFVDGHVSWFHVSAYWNGTSGITNNPALRWGP
jgi:prepilin-type processing-associated H-X9-DG protein